ncbi:MAG: circularly permuted type 2 ATP-grasp protein, partial [Paracoccaceae bacterium]|nr:circularly permuted type 2 ATP-grasp protein [Paracoccaceae bacterium]
MYHNGRAREPYLQLENWTLAMPAEFRSLKQAEAEALFRRIGITFAVYGEGGDPDRLIPFDMFPRVFSNAEWTRLERGIKQRARALNAFLVDIYGRGEIVRTGRIPGRLVYQ